MKLRLREKPLQDDRISLYIESYHQGKRNYEFLNLYLESETGKDKRQIARKNKATKELAEKILAKRSIELENSEYGFSSSSMKKRNFYDYWEKVASSKSEQTRTTYNQVLRFIKIYSKEEQNLSIKDITPNWIENFTQFLQTELTDNSIIVYLSKIKTVFNYLLRKEIILRTPFNKANIQLKKKQAKRNYLTFEELEKLANIEIKDSREYEFLLAFLLTAYCGLRYSDIIKLRWKDIQSDDTIAIVQTKTQETLYIDLNETAKKVIEQVKKLRNYLDDNTIFNCFPKVNTSSTNKVLQRFVERAGIKKNISFHCLRHSFATNFISCGGDLYVLMNLLGHKDITSTQIYGKIISERRKEAVKLFPILAIKERVI